MKVWRTVGSICFGTEKFIRAETVGYEKAEAFRWRGESNGVRGHAIDDRGGEVDVEDGCKEDYVDQDSSNDKQHFLKLSHCIYKQVIFPVSMKRYRHSRG